MSKLHSNIIVEIRHDVMSINGVWRNARITIHKEVRAWIEENIAWKDFWVDSQNPDSLEGLTLYREEDFNLLKLVFGDRYNITRRMFDKVDL